MEKIFLLKLVRGLKQADTKNIMIDRCLHYAMTVSTFGFVIGLFVPWFYFMISGCSDNVEIYLIASGAIGYALNFLYFLIKYRKLIKRYF